MKKDLCSITISRNLKELGFKGLTHYYYSNEYKTLRHDEILRTIKNWNGHFYGQVLNLTSVPTVDQAIDWLRRKYNIVIYNAIEPFVDPIKKPRILYRYSVKKCNLRDGWNGRKYIGESKLVENIYSAKRQAIMLAIRYIKSQKDGKTHSTHNE